jgi:hypothetical protein
MAGQNRKHNRNQKNGRSKGQNSKHNKNQKNGRSKGQNSKHNRNQKKQSHQTIKLAFVASHFSAKFPFKWFSYF